MWIRLGGLAVYHHFPPFRKVQLHYIAGSPMFHTVDFINYRVNVFAHGDADGDFTIRFLLRVSQLYVVNHQI